MPGFEADLVFSMGYLDHCTKAHSPIPEPLIPLALTIKCKIVHVSTGGDIFAVVILQPLGMGSNLKIYESYFKTKAC
jgi:hypothetical protein